MGRGNNNDQLPAGWIKLSLAGVAVLMTLQAEAIRLPWFGKKHAPKVKEQKEQPAVIDGRVTEEEFEEPLEKAIVQIRGSAIYTLTNRFGYFRMELPPAFFELEAIHPGVYSEFYNVTTYDRILTPIGAVRLEPVSVGRLAQRDLSARVNPVQHPGPVRNTPVFDMLSQAGSTNFNELFSRQPSVYLVENGGGYNASEIRVRGFAANQNQVVFNGISLNDPETGAMNTALYPGLNDWAQQVQFSSGMVSAKQSEAGQTGLINVLPVMPAKKAGAGVLASYGEGGYLKTAATVHSGMSRRRLAFALKLDRAAGDGVPDFTGFESYGLCINLYKEYSHMHRFIVTSVLRTWQADGRSRPDSVARIARLGVDHNSQWGFANGVETGWNGSFGLASLNMLTHYWHLRVNTRLVSQLYAEFGNSAQTAPQGFLGNLSPAELLPTDRGLIDFEAISTYNSGKTVSENDGISIRADVTRSTRFGFQTQLIRDFSKETRLAVSADAEQYEADHFGALNNLLGASAFVSEADVNSTGTAVSRLLVAGFLPQSGQADRVGHNYRSVVRRAGVAAKLQTSGNRAFAYTEGAFWVKSLKREDRFNYSATSATGNSAQVSQVGWRFAGGLTYRLSEAHSVRATAGASGSPARFDVVFPAGNNWQNKTTSTQNLYGSDLAWVVNSGHLFLSVGGYAMYLDGRSDIQRLGLAAGESYAVITGISQFHRGIEFNSQLTYLRRCNLHLSASLGKWTFAGDAQAAIYDAARQLTGQLTLALNGFDTDNCAPVSLYAKHEINLLKGLEMNVNYYRSFGTYAPLPVHQFDGGQIPAQVKLPAFDRLGAGLNYYHEFGRNRALNVFADVQNLLGSQYINQLFTNSGGTANFGNNLALYGTAMSWRAGFCFSF